MHPTSASSTTALLIDCAAGPLCAAAAAAAISARNGPRGAAVGLSTRNSLRSFPAVQFGGLPRPIQVAPVFSSRYLVRIFCPVISMETPAAQ